LNVATLGHGEEGKNRMKEREVKYRKVGKCPNCGSDDTSSDATLDKDGNLIDEYDFCFNCGHTWNRRKTEYCLGWKGKTE
jgi:transcription elongation factor Elf1